MKRILALSLCTVLCSGYLMNIGVLTWFEVQKDYIVSELCENRDVEDSDCNGHCVLNKKMADPPQNKDVVVETESFVFLIPKEQQTIHLTTQTKPGMAPCKLRSNAYHVDIFHPPQVQS